MRLGDRRLWAPRDQLSVLPEIFDPAARLTLQDLADIGELVGAIGVIVSLGYLTTQMRQNTRALKTAAYQDTTRAATGFAAQVADDGEAAHILRMGLGDSRELDADERMRFSMLLIEMFFNMQNLYTVHRQDNVDREFWESQRRVLLWYLERPGVRHWWASSKDRPNRSFVEYVDAQIA